MTEHEQLEKILKSIYLGDEHDKRVFLDETCTGFSEAITKLETMLRETRVDTITQIMSVKTEGLFDNGDLFIKRKPIDQVCIDILGYETFKAIQGAIPVATPFKEGA